MEFLSARTSVAIAILLEGLLLGGCGSREPSKSDEVNLARTEERVESAFDAPVVAAVRTMVRGVEQIWVFACDSAGHFKRATAVNNFGGRETWSTWEDYGAGCLAVPSAIAAQLSASPPRVSAYVTWNDGHLWELKWNDSASFPSWVDVSGLAGFGVVRLSPFAIDGTSTLSEVSVAARATNNDVYTFDFYDGTWHFAPVVDSSGNVIRSANTLQGGDGGLTGRGLSSTDDSTGWVALRSRRRDGSMRRVTSVPSFRTRGTPVRYNSLGGTYILANLDGTLHALHTSTGNWLRLVESCSVSGSPAPSVNAGVNGFVRSAAGNLMRYSGDPVGIGKCTDLDVWTNSGVEGVPQHAFFKGVLGRIHHWDDTREILQNLGLTVP